MSEPEEEAEKAEESVQRAPAATSAKQRRNSARQAEETTEGRRPSITRRASLTQGLKDGGRTVAKAVGAIFKERDRGELFDPDDDPENVKIRPSWEDELKKYLPETESYPQPWNTATSPETRPYSSGNIASSAGNIASSSSNAPMVPTKVTENAAFNLLIGGTNAFQSLAAHRWHKAYQFVKRQNALKKASMSTPIGTGARLHGRSLGIIPKEDATRKMVFDTLYQEKTEYLLLCIISSHVFVLILKAETKFVTSFKPKKSDLDAADIFLTTLYTVELVSRIFCLGLCRGPHSFLQNAYNKLDLVIVVDSWVHIGRTRVLGRDPFARIAILRIFRALLSLRQFSFVGNVLAIMDAIVKSVYSLRTVLVFSVMILSFYSLVGLLFFGGVLQNRCVRVTDGQFSVPPRFCTLEPNALYGHVCPPEQDQFCVPGENPNWGLTSFDNYAAGMLILFQMMTFEGWSLIMYSVADVNGYSEAYFVVFVVFGSYFLVNIYIAAISSVFLRVRHEHQILLKRYRKDKAFTFANAINLASLLKDVILRDDAKLTWRQRFALKTKKGVAKFRASMSRQGTRLKRTMTKAVDWNDPNAYLKRISSFGLSGIDEIDMQESGGSSGPPGLRRSMSRNLSMGTRQAARFGRSMSRNISMGTIRAAQTLSQKATLIVESKFFSYAVLTIISLNMAGLCTYRAKMSSTHRTRLEIMEIGMLIVFGAEMILRFVAAGPVNFVDERMNIVDVAVIVISSGATGFGPSKKYPNLTPIRMLRWFYKKKSHDPNIEADASIVVAIVRSFGPLSSVFFFLLLVVLVFAIIAMELWGGDYNDFPEGYPRANFDTIFQAMITWFSVTTAESWPDQMWNSMRPGVSYQWMGPILFVVYYMISAIVIINLIMAVILEQTELTDYQKKHIQKRDHIKWLQTKHTHHVASTRSSEWLVGAVKGAQKGYKGMKNRMSTIRVSRMSLFPVLQPETGFVRMMAPPQVEPPQSDVLPRIGSRAFLAIPESPLPSRRHSHTAVSIPGATSEPRVEAKTKARIFRRSSLGALSSAGLLPQAVSGMRSHRRLSDDSEKVALRSGFGALKAEPGENRTALQSALMTVVLDQKMVAERVVEDKRKAAAGLVATAAVPSRPDPRLAHPTLGKMPSRKAKGPRLSFSLAEYEGFKPLGEKQTPWWLSDPSLFLFPSNGRFRIFCTKLAENWWYQQWQILFVIASISIVIEQTTLGFYFVLTFTDFFLVLDWIVLMVFAVDLILKSIAYGFLFTPESYLADPYNFIDLFNLVVHAMRMKTNEPGPWQNTFIILSAIRPTRFIVRFQGLRSLTTSIFRTIPAISQVFTFTVVIYSIFAVIGMQLYANRFRSCTDSTVAGHDDCVGFFLNSNGILGPRTWINPPFHFDGFGEAMLSLFVASTFDSWLDYFLYTSMDLAHHQELQPQRNISPSHALFFISFACIGGFFILRMFVGVFIDQFGIISGSKLLTERQKLWRDTNRIIQALNPTRLPKHTRGSVRGICYRIVHSRNFELVVVFTVITNYAYIAAQHYGQVTPVRVFDSVEAMFVSLYLLEALLKLLGTELKDWWHHKWNAIELILVLMSASCLWPERQSDSLRRTVGAFVYLIRIFRIIRYVPQLSTMVTTVLISLPGMVDIIGLMGVVLFLFAGIGKQMFYNIKDGTCLSENLSFQGFMTSFVLLFQITTLDNWSCVLTDITVASPSCVMEGGSYEDDCGFPIGGLVYMLVLVCVTSHIFANLFVAQIIDCITFGLLDENAMITPHHLYEYQLLWAERDFDYRCTGYIGLHKLRSFLRQLGPPLGLRLTYYDKWITRIEYEALRFRGAKGLPFRALLETLVLYKIGPRGLELPLRIERERQLMEVYRAGAATKIQALARGYFVRKGWKPREVLGGEEEETRPVMEPPPRGAPPSDVPQSDSPGGQQASDSGESSRSKSPSPHSEKPKDRSKSPPPFK